jgi:hypothetical protein
MSKKIAVVCAFFAVISGVEQVSAQAPTAANAALKTCLVGAGSRWDQDNPWRSETAEKQEMTEAIKAACATAERHFKGANRSLLFTMGAWPELNAGDAQQMERLEKAKALGSAAAYRITGYAKLRGTLWPKDRGGLDDMRQAASMGDAGALWNMAAIYGGTRFGDFNPPLVGPDPALSNAYLERAAAAGHPRAQQELAELAARRQQQAAEAAEYERELARIRAERRAEERAEREAEQAETAQAIGTVIGALLGGGGRSGRQVTGSTGGTRSCPTNHYWSSTYNRCVCTGPSANGVCYSETSGK